MPHTSTESSWHTFFFGGGTYCVKFGGGKTAEWASCINADIDGSSDEAPDDGRDDSVGCTLFSHTVGKLRSSAIVEAGTITSFDTASETYIFIQIHLTTSKTAEKLLFWRETLSTVVFTVGGILMIGDDTWSCSMRLEISSDSACLSHLYKVIFR